jgi:hypothetical protein
MVVFLHRYVILPMDAGTGGQEKQPPPLPFTKRGKGGKGAVSI